MEHTLYVEGGYLTYPIEGTQETIQIPFPPGLYTSELATLVARHLLRERGIDAPIGFTLPEPEPKPAPVEPAEGKCRCSCSCYSCDEDDCPSRI